MKQRGRQSETAKDWDGSLGIVSDTSEPAASLPDVSDPEGQLVVESREPPPEDLTDEQGVIWVDTLQRMPANWFKDSVGTLIQYCRHRARAARLAQLVEAHEALTDDFDQKTYQSLLKSEGDNTRIIESCETKLRLTPQTRFDKSKKSDPPGKPPWQE